MYIKTFLFGVVMYGLQTLWLAQVSNNFRFVVTLILLLLLIILRNTLPKVGQMTQDRVMMILMRSIVMYGLIVVYTSIFTHPSSTFNVPNVWLFGATTIIIAPIAEELIFRYTLAGKLGAGITRVLVGNILFALIHNENIVLYFIIGIYLTYVYTKTDNIWDTIFIHGLANSMTFLLYIVGN